MFMTERDTIGQNEELEDELDLANFIINKYNLAYGEYYYGINLISRNLKVTPDIDLLNVNINDYHPEENTVVGFELKVLKYYSRRNRIELSPFYQGLGQVLTYFHHGIDRAMLIVGFHNNCGEYPEAIKDASNLMKRHCELLKVSTLIAFPYLSIASVTFGSLEFLLHVSDWDRQRFHPQTEEAKLRRASIFKKQFSSKKVLLKDSR